MRVCLIFFTLYGNRNSTNIFLNIVNVNSWNLSRVSHGLYSFHESTQYVYWRNVRELADSHQNTQLGRGRVRIHTEPGCKLELSTPEGHLVRMKGTQVFTSLCWRQAEAFRGPFHLAWIFLWEDGVSSCCLLFYMPPVGVVEPDNSVILPIKVQALSRRFSWPFTNSPSAVKYNYIIYIKNVSQRHYFSLSKTIKMRTFIKGRLWNRKLNFH